MISQYIDNLPPLKQLTVMVLGNAVTGMVDLAIIIFASEVLGTIGTLLASLAGVLLTLATSYYTYVKGISIALDNRKKKLDLKKTILEIEVSEMEIKDKALELKKKEAELSPGSHQP